MSSRATKDFQMLSLVAESRGGGVEVDEESASALSSRFEIGMPGYLVY